MRRVWAVAINTVRQILRVRVAVAFIILLVILLTIMGLTMTGDGTVKGRLQTFLSYGMSLTSFMLCLFTIAASVYSFTSDIKQRQVYTVLTKPLSRVQLIGGKLIGVILIDAVLLVLFSSIIYTITIYTPRFADVTEEEHLELSNEFYTARASLLPEEPDVSKEALETYEKLERDGLIKPTFSRSKVLKELTERIKLGRQAAGPGDELVWEFENVKPVGADQQLFIKFKYDVSRNPPDLRVHGKWAIGDFRQSQAQMVTPVYTFERRDLIRTSYEIEVPADCIGSDGYLAVAFFNDPRFNSTVVIFSPQESIESPQPGGIEVLYKADTFTANFIKGVLLIFFRLIFLAVLGITASTFLSFPVAILLCGAIFFMGTMSSFALESFETLSEGLSEIYYYTFRLFIKLLPQFDRFNPMEFMVSAKLMSWPFVAAAGGFMIGIKSVLLLIVSWLVFERREIAKVTV